MPASPSRPHPSDPNAGPERATLTRFAALADSIAEATRCLPLRQRWGSQGPAPRTTPSTQSVAAELLAPGPTRGRVSRKAEMSRWRLRCSSGKESRAGATRVQRATARCRFTPDSCIGDTRMLIGGSSLKQRTLSMQVAGAVQWVAAGFVRSVRLGFCRRTSGLAFPRQSSSMTPCRVRTDRWSQRMSGTARRSSTPILWCGTWRPATNGRSVRTPTRVTSSGRSHGARTAPCSPSLLPRLPPRGTGGRGKGR
jgi:hypothetical protein